MSDPGRGTWTATVGANEAGIRLDSFVAACAGCSRSRARELLGRGAVEVEGRRAGPGDKGRILRAGERVRVDAAAAFLDRLVPDPDSPLVVLASGGGWVAVDKPPGLPVHPLRAEERGTLLQRVAARWPQIEEIGEKGRRGGVVHRLDVDTSGVQLFAFEEATWRRLRGAFAEHRIEKVYRAIVRGDLVQEGEIELPLVIASHRPGRVRVARAHDARGSTRACALVWKVVERLAGASLVEVRPRTGFLHQVRVTLAHLGHPLLGDAVYGGRDEVAAARRHMLHAAALRFEEIEVHGPDAEDFRDLLVRLRAG